MQIKTLIAYSTVSQAGYFFLIFALANTAATQAGWLLLFSHALAKATLFLAAGNLVRYAQSGAIGALKGSAQALPMTLFGALLAALSLAGLPPTGGFAGKWLLLQSALLEGQWLYAAVLIIGSLLAMGYLIKLLSHTLGAPEQPAAAAVPKPLEWVVLIGGVLCVALGFGAAWVIAKAGL